MRPIHDMVGIALIALALAAAPAMGLDCSHKTPCPPGTTAQEAVSCDACCVEGLAITSATDRWCCPLGQRPTQDFERCVPTGAILKADGSCWVMAEADPCCREGWRSVNKYECCPDGYSLATDSDNCCTQRADGKCCPERYTFNDVAGVCRPPRPAGVIIR